jgi:hypothetical protein
VSQVTRSVFSLSFSEAAIGAMTPPGAITSRRRAGASVRIEASVAARVVPGLSWHTAQAFW